MINDKDLGSVNWGDYDAVFVCSLPPNRLDIAIKCAEEKNNLFIEKPLSHNLEGVYKLQEIVEKNKVNCAIGYQMRFHPVIQNIKNMVENNEFGNIYRIEVNHCNSIYNWTSGRDLKEFYVFKEENGGGVLLSQIHEIDYLNYIFGKHYPISAIYGNRLGFEVEDFITILGNLEKEGDCIPVTINLDFLEKTPRREIVVYGTDRVEKFNLLPKDSDEWNTLFLEEMRAFLNLLVGKKDERLATLEDGISSLEYCIDIKNNFIKLNNMV